MKKSGPFRFWGSGRAICLPAYLLLVLPFGIPFSGFAQDAGALPKQDAVTALLKEAKQQEASFRENDAFLTYQQVLKLQPHNVMVLCKCADLCCQIGNRQTAHSLKVDYFKAGKTYADAAYRLSPNDCEVNISMAFAIGRMALIESAREKVAAAGAIKKYAENAIKDDPANFKGYHILARWNYEVSALNPVERTLAKWFYGAIPEGSLQDAIGYFKKSMALAPNFMLNYLELAKTYRRTGRKDLAIPLLRHMDALPDLMLDDTRVRTEGKKLLAELQ